MQMGDVSGRRILGLSSRRWRQVAGILAYVLAAPFVLCFFVLPDWFMKRWKLHQLRREMAHFAKLKAQYFPPPPGPHVAESETRLRVRMEKGSAEETFSRSLAQEQSPLFNKVR